MGVFSVIYGILIAGLGALVKGDPSLIAPYAVADGENHKGIYGRIVARLVGVHLIWLGVISGAGGLILSFFLPDRAITVYILLTTTVLGAVALMKCRWVVKSMRCR